MSSKNQRINRRDILKLSAAGIGIAALGPLARAIPRMPAGRPLPGCTRLVVINCYGGFDGLNMVVPVTNQAYYSLRPTVSISPSNAIALNGVTDYALHPNMVNMASLFNTDGRLAVIRKVGYPNENLSHFASQDIYSHAVRGAFPPLGIAESGWIARYAGLYAPTPLGAVSIGVGRKPDMVGGTSDRLMVKKLADFQFQQDNSYPDNHLHRRQTIANLLGIFQGSPLTSDVATVLGQGDQFAGQIQGAVQNFQPAAGVTYPSSSPGRYLEDVATIIQAGFETRIFFTGFGGWDTHGDQGNETGRQADRITRLDEAIGNFVTDIKAMGVWNDTLILVVSEFGRRNFENSSNGTDHGHGNVFFAMGGNVLGGFYGPAITDEARGEGRRPSEPSPTSRCSSKKRRIRASSCSRSRGTSS